MTKWDLSQACKDDSPFENLQIQSVNQLTKEEKNHKIILVDVEKLFDKTNTIFDKTISKLGIEGNLFNVTKNIKLYS